MSIGAGRRPPDLQARALRWLAQREHSRVELRAKLLRSARQAAARDPGDGSADDERARDNGDDDRSDAPAVEIAAIDALLDRLEARGLLSDERFVQSRLRVRATGAGLRRLEAELARHALALPAADRERLQASEVQRAAALWRHRFGGVAADPKERARQMRFLAGRGFAADVIRRAAAALRAGD